MADWKCSAKEAKAIKAVVKDAPLAKDLTGLSLIEVAEKLETQGCKE